MQVREQWKGSRNWKLVTGAATAATLSLGALAIAISGGADDRPSVWVFLDERAAASPQVTAGGFVPFDLGTFTGLHADRIVHDDPYFGGGPFWDTRPLSADGPAVQAGSVVAPPVTDGAAGAASDGVAESDDADETTSPDVLSDEGVDATGDTTAEVTDDGISDDGVMDDGVVDGPSVAVADDPLSDDSVFDDATDFGSDESIADESIADESIADESIADESIADDSDDSRDESDDSRDDSDDSD